MYGKIIVTQLLVVNVNTLPPLFLTLDKFLSCVIQDMCITVVFDAKDCDNTQQGLLWGRHFLHTSIIASL